MKYLIVLLAFIPIFAIAESYLCLTEAVGGVHYNESQKIYKGQGFSNEYKWILKKNGAKWEVFQHGNVYPHSTSCTERKIEDDNKISCEIPIAHFIMFTKKLRYVYIYYGTWTGPIELNGKTYNDSSYIEVGSCTGI